MFCLIAAVLIFSLTPPGREFFTRANYLLGFNDLREETALLEIHTIDVGKADAILIRSQGHAALIDAGKSLSGGPVVDYLRRHNVWELDYAVMSHPDNDHIGGMPQVLTEVPVGTFVQAALPESLSLSGAEYQDMEKQIGEQKISRLVLAPGDTITLGAAKLTAVGPMGTYGDPNNSSLVLRLDCGDFSALFCGDMESEAEQDLILSGQNIDVDLLKVGHHGSKTSSSLRFVWETSPQYAVISVALDRNALPRDEVLARLEEQGAEIYRTDTDGSIIFIYDGENISVRLEREENTDYETVDHRPF